MASLAPRSGPLGKRLAAHLLRRTTFGPTRAEIDNFASLTASDAVESLMTFPPLPDHPKDPQTGLTWVVSGRTAANTPNDELEYIVGSWWLHQIFDPNLPLSAFQRVVFFLHTSFVTGYNDIEWSENHYYSLRLLMHYAQGSYQELAVKICLDNGMNDYLDIGDSLKANPNENFVREFLELYTIGKGPTAGPDDYTTFTEQDVYEASRLMTGFRLNNSWDDPAHIDAETGLPRARLDVGNHDETDKIFSPRFQDTIIAGQNTEAGMIQEVQDFVAMIFAQDATAENICRRMYRFFVKYNITPEVETDIIIPLANTLRNNNYEIVTTLKELLKSEHFYDEDDADSSDNIIGSLIKSPLELQSGMIRFFQVPIPDPEVDLFEAYVTFYRWGIQQALSKACFDLFAPPEVAGYQPVYQAPEYNRLWVSAKSLPARYAIADEHLDGPDHLKIDVMAFVEDAANVTDFGGNDPLGNPGPHQGARIASHLVQELIDYLLPEALDTDRFDYFLKEVLLDNLTDINWMNEWDAYVATGDDTNVEPQIKRLIKGILQSPEYQLI